MAPPLSGQSTKFASPLGAGYFEVGKGLNAIKAGYDQTKTFLNSSKFAATGAIADLAGEFGNAVKQVLLYGTAYKALAFLTSLPGEAFEATKALATYQNQLQAVTEQSQTFDRSLAFVDNLATRFNVPLDSARQGFVKLYASMEPAGFKQGQIENLFTGISKAAAAFGLSSDKVDRVNYAFAQMASKGQIMSEELKGQLGDVLPGALGLFAEAAQMTIPEFSKAMEDGAFKGGAMEQVLGNVSILLNNKFSKAASGAAKTLQGAVNQIQNNLKLMYESFTPIVNGAAAAFGPQINGLIKDVTATMKVLTGTFVGAGNGFATLSPRAQAFYTAIKTLEPSIRQAGAAIVDLGGRIGQLVPVFVQVLAATISFASSPLGRAALLAAIAIGTLTASLALLEATGLKAAIKQVYAFVGTLYAVPAATGAARLGVIALKLAVTGLFIGAILVGLDYVIGKILKIGDAAQQSIKDVKQLASDLDGLASSQDLIGLATKNKQAQNEVIIAERLLELYTKMDENKKKGAYEYKGLSQQQREFVRAYGTENPFESGVDFANKKLTAAMEKRGMTQKALNNAQKLADDETARRAKELTKLGKVDLDEDAKKKQNLESYYSLLDDLAKATTQAEVDRAEAAFNHQRDLINAEYDYREARANSFQAKAIAFQREIFNIVSKQEEESLRNRNKIKLAAGSVSGLSPAGGGPTVGGSAGLTSYITGDPSQKGKGYQPDHGTVKDYHDHLAFATRELAIQAYKKLTAADIKVTEFKGYGKGVTGPHSGAGSLHHQGLAMDVPGYQWGGTGAIGAKEYAGSARVRQVMGIGDQASVGAPRKVPGSEKREEISQRKTGLLTNEARAAAIEKEASATEELRIATARYTASLLPTAEQGLQNQLLEQKINLTRAGASPSILEAQLTYARQELETNENIRINTLEIEKLTAAGGKNSKVINVLKVANAELRASLPVSQVQLLTKSILEQADAIIAKAAASKQARSDENRINELIISGLTREQAEAKLAAEVLEKDYAAAVKVINDKIKEYSNTLAILNLQKASGIALDKGQIEEYARLQKAIEDLEKAKAGGKNKKDEATSTPLPKEKTFKESITSEKAKISEQLKEMTKPANMLIGLAKQIGSSFSDAFVKVIDGTASAQEALAGFFKSIGDYLIQYGAQMLSLAIIKGILGLFGNGAAFDSGGITKNAKGNAFTGGGIAKFATGGIVNGPTLFPFADGGAMRMGLMGEAGPEAILPLQRGADGALGVRAAMGGNGMGGSSSPILNMNFETSTINGVEYVSRDQLEAAMVQTRRQASSDGAKRGMAMTLDKIQQSPQTRRRIGM
jgi:tape measure domain-containing protein